MAHIERFKLSRMKAPALLIAAVLLMLLPQPASADLGPAMRSVPQAALVGKGRLTYLGFKVFDAELYAPNGAYSPQKPFALKLTYLRNFKGKAIADQSAKEMKKLGGISDRQLTSWTQQMQAIFPNVRRGQSISGVRTASGSADFYLGNRKLGTIRDPAFTRSFFAIWLGNSSRNQQLRARLTGSGR